MKADMTCAIKRMARPVRYWVVDDSDSPWFFAFLLEKSHTAKEGRG